MNDEEETAGYKQLLEESLEELYENAPCGYVSTWPDGTFAKMNATFLRWIGAEREELLAGKRFQDMLIIGGKIFYETHYAPLLAMQGFVNEIAFDLKCRDGRQLPVLVSTVQKRDAYGTPILNRTTIFNATDRRAYEQELLQARRKAEQAIDVKSRFLATVSHEIRTPLTAIDLATQALLRMNKQPNQERYLRVLQLSSQNLLALVNDILDFSKIEAGMVELEESPFNLRELARTIIMRLEPKAEEKDISLQLELDDRLPDQVLGDPTKIGQVLTNLLGNAIKFTKQGYTKLSIVLQELHADTVVLDISVEDTGIGIPPDRLAHIFEEFAQASGDISVMYGGTGLGLAISRKLLQLYGCEIQVQSTPGIGSIFFFSITLNVPAASNPTSDGAG